MRYIGKEANRCEEQFYLGRDPEAQIEYDGGPDAVEQIRDRIRAAAAAFGQRRLARASGIAREQIQAITHNDAVPLKRDGRTLAASDIVPEFIISGSDIGAKARCDWENEIACWHDSYPPNDVLITFSTTGRSP